VELVKLQNELIAVEDRTTKLERRVNKLDRMSAQLTTLQHQVELSEEKIKVIELICADTREKAKEITKNQTELLAFMNKFKGAFIVAALIIGTPAFFASVITILDKIK